MFIMRVQEENLEKFLVGLPMVWWVDVVRRHPDD